VSPILTVRKASEPVEFYDDTDPIIHSFITHDCPTQKVTVYSDRAEVTRSVIIEAKTIGLHNIVITGFPSKVIRNTFRVSSGTGHVKILEVSELNTSAEETPDAQKSSAQENSDKIKQLKRREEILHTTQTRLQGEEDYLIQYSTSLTWPFTVVRNDAAQSILKATSLTEADEFLKMYREKLSSIKAQKLELSKI